MKKFINVIIALSIFFAFTGCTTKNDISTSASSSYENTTKSTELEESSLEHADTFIPDAKEYDVIIWPTFGIATKIPMPTWSDRGVFYSSETSETLLWAEIGYTTIDDYRNYVEACKAYGYDKNIHEEIDSVYYAENEEGYAVDLLYVPWSKYIGIQATSNAEGWSSWWEE